MKIEDPFMEIPVLETENYQLRGLDLEDAFELYQFLSDRKTMQYITPHPVQSLEKQEQEIINQLENFRAKKEIPWVIIDKSSLKIAGIIRLYKISLWHQKAEMGVVLREMYQNKGVMTEVLAEVLDYGFQCLKLNRIVGDIFAGNKGSRKLLEKYGFLKDGIMRQTDFDGEMFHDTVVYSMLKDEYIQSNAFKSRVK